MRSWRFWGPAVAAIALAACIGAATRSEAVPAPLSAPPAARQAAGGLVADVIGINEAISVPSRMVPRLSAAQLDERIAGRIAAVRALGVRHVRVHTASAPYLSWRDGAFEGYAMADQFLLPILAAGLDPVVMVGPWPGNAPSRGTDHYVPADPDAYARWVVATVERYDGDGIDDAPGLARGVTVWEVDNEPDLHNTVPPKGGPGRVDPSAFETPEEYVRVALITATAIREADADARVLPAGLFGPDQAKFAAYFPAIWSDPAFREAFPEANTHCYSGIANVWEGVADVSEAAGGRPVWVTEVSVSSEKRGEAGQAADLARLYLEALRRGTPRVYWHSLQEAPLRAEGGQALPPQMTGNHLLRAEGEGQGRWKLSAWTLHELATLWATIPRESVSDVPAEGGQALRIGEDVYVWGGGPDAGEVRVTLPDGPVTVKGLVPTEADGNGAQWPTRSHRVKNGRLSVDVSAGPVRIVAEEG